MSLEKITRGDEQTKSLDLVSENISKLRELFPEIVTEGKIDFKALQEILGEELEEGEEYYHFTWAGKSQARREAHKPSTGTLRPCKEESVDWDTTKNLYIEGDNLEVLKLMQKSYANKVKMIYIDPPYNTGKDFVYKDNYKDNLKNYQQITRQVNDEGNKLSTNSDSDGRYHSNWLNMMYPRLRLARNLLKDNGAIFISLDESEIENMKKIGKEIFGEENYICTSCINRTSEIASSNVISKHEYLIVFCKNIKHFKVEGLTKVSISRGTVGNADQTTPIIEFPAGLECRNIKDGTYNQTRQIPGSSENITTHDEIIVKNGKLFKPVRLQAKWRSSNDMRNFFDNDCKPTEAKISGFIKEIYFEGDRFMPQIVKSTFEKIPTIYLENKRGSNDLNSLDMEGTMDFPKSVDFLKTFISFIKTNDEIVLDFFSGSATTAHSILKLNAEDNGERKFIMVQLPEITDEKSYAFKAGFKTIAEIGKERIRRAGNKIAEENPDKSKDLDLGFKVFKLDSSNIKGWDGNPDDLEASLFDAQENIKVDRTEEDVLFEILLKYGLDLTFPIDEKLIEGKKVFSVGFGALFICLTDGITNKVAEAVGAWKQELNPATCRVIFKDSGFSDVEKANAVQTLKRFGIIEIKSI
jgi:adenine-specific DNA-methyltransferase